MEAMNVEQSHLVFGRQTKRYFILFTNQKLNHIQVKMATGQH